MHKISFRIQNSQNISCTFYELRKTTLVCTKRWKSTSPTTHSTRKFFDELAIKIGIENLDDWYKKITTNIILEHGGQDGKRIAKLFKNSSPTALMSAYPEHDWTPWKFISVPKGYWNNISNQRKYFDWLGKEMGIKRPDDWYEKLSVEVFTKNGASGLLLKQYKGSPIAAIMAAYPEHNWIPWKFSTVPRDFWTDSNNQRNFFEYVGKEIGIQTLDDWYEKLSLKLIEKYGGSGMLAKYKDKVVAALMATYPEHNWTPWKFNHVPHTFWKDTSNLRKFFDDLGKQLEIQTLDDWYTKLSVNAVNQHGRLPKMFRGSPVEALKVAYPEHNWIPWKFNYVTRGFWKSKNNIGAFLSELSEKLSIQSLDDWYRVDWIQLKQNGATSILSKYKGLYNILKQQYPDHPWDPNRFKQVGKKGQRWLAVSLKKIFPNEQILEDYQHSKAVFASSKRPIQLDIFIPSKSLAFEYQGKQHFEDVGMFCPSSIYQQRDAAKRALCVANNIKLIEIPYWWNRTQEQLQEMIDKSY